MSVQKTLITVWALALVALTLVAAMYHNTQLSSTTPVLGRATVRVGGATVQVEVADNPALHQRGLSGKTHLAVGEGMLFVFEEEAEHGIWMKNMQFAIDIVWAADDGTIVTIKKGATPESYPEAFYPTAPARYVLEVPSGFVAAEGIAEGQKIVVQ